MSSDVPPQHAQARKLHKEHPTSVAFFDETGAIASDRFFVVGLLRITDHPSLNTEVRALRRRHKYREEFKWSGITAKNLHVYVELIDLLVSSPAKFSCFVADRHVADPVARFGDTFAAYEKLATQLLLGSIRPYELISVIADNYSAPNSRSFENAVLRECNGRLNRLAVVSVVQVDSAATAGLQLVDVLTGAVGFNFRANARLASHATHKGRVAAHLRAVCGVNDFNFGHADPDFNVKVYEHQAWLTKEQARLNSSKVGSSKRRRGTRGGRRRANGVPRTS